MELADAIRFVIAQGNLKLSIAHQDFGDFGVIEPTVTILDAKTKLPPEMTWQLATVQRTLSQHSLWFLNAGRTLGLVTLAELLEHARRQQIAHATPKPQAAPKKAAPQGSHRANSIICSHCQNFTTNASGKCTDCQRKSTIDARSCCSKCWSWNCHGHRVLKNEPERTERRNRRMHRLRSWWDQREGWEMHRSVQFQWRRS